MAQILMVDYNHMCCHLDVVSTRKKHQILFLAKSIPYRC